MPPLLLEQSFISKLRIDAIAAHSPGGGDESEVETQVSMGQAEDNPERWQVMVELSILPNDQKPGPYGVEMRIHGYFRLPPDIPEEQAQHLLGITGASILYSAAREHLLLVTGRGPWGPIQLPTASFAPARAAGSEEVAERPTGVADPKRKGPKRGSKAPRRR
jgi:preprotein translocase subunit SecB